MRGNPRPAVERFWEKVDKTSGCWLWTAALWKGYGRIAVGRRMVKAHRFSYELLIGPIPDGMTIDHRCRVRSCVNPAHLEVVTNAENVMRGHGACAQHARKTHCANGHAFTDENTYVRPSRPRARECVSCQRQAGRAYKARKRAQA
jgi:hypothetical protein